MNFAALLRRIGWSCAFVITTHSALAQGEITADFVQDRGVLVPGIAFPLIIEISNPDDSGIVIENWRGGSGGSSEGSQYFQLEFVETCGNVSFCPVDQGNTFPIYPGHSAQFYHYMLNINSDAPTGALVRVRDISLKLTTTNYRQLNDIHLQHDFIGIISSGTPVSPSYLESLDTKNPKAGQAQVVAELTLRYPSQVQAGESIEVTGTILNLGNEEITGLFILGSDRHQGSLLNSFRQIFCQFKCLYSGEFPLQINEQVDVLFRQFYYENDYLLTGDLAIRGPHAIIRDSLNRNAYLYTDDIEIEITHNGTIGEPSPPRIVPDRAPLERSSAMDPSGRTVVYDPNTEKSWILLSETQGLALPKVIFETRDGGQFAGYSVASSNEVRTLILNHIYASGSNYPSYALYQGSQDLHDLAGTFLDLIGTTHAPGQNIGNTRYARGMVADAPEPGQRTVEMSAYQQNTPGSIFGTHGSFNISSYYASGYSGMGTWLVSNPVWEQPTTSNEQEIKAVDNDPVYSYGQLFLASLTIANTEIRYKVTFKLIDKVNSVFELVSVLDEYNRPTQATYDDTSHLLHIPRVGVSVFPEEYVYYDVTLDWIPDSDPPRFRVRDVVLLSD